MILAVTGGRDTGPGDAVRVRGSAGASVSLCKRCGTDTPRYKSRACVPCARAASSARNKIWRRTPKGVIVAARYRAKWVARPGNKELHKKLTAAWGATTEGTARRLFTRARRRARDGALPFSISLDDIRAKVIAGICEVSGLPFVIGQPGHIYTPSIDQIRAGEGYTQQNTRVVLWGINVACHTWGLEAITEIFRSVP
jgi:hypothetical protein